MFDFIKSSDPDDVKAFQWFIENTGPFDDHQLLTVDMLRKFRVVPDNQPISASLSSKITIIRKNQAVYCEKQQLYTTGNTRITRHSYRLGLVFYDFFKLTQ